MLLCFWQRRLQACYAWLTSPSMLPLIMFIYIVFGALSIFELVHTISRRGFGCVLVVGFALAPCGCYPEFAGVLNAQIGGSSECVCSSVADVLL